MNGNSRRIWSIGNGLGEAAQVLRYGLKFFRCLFQSKTVLAAKVTALESQIEILQERAESQGVGRFRFNEAFRFLWVILSTTWGGWKSVCRVMQPRTVTKWHERVVRFFWRWKCAAGVGRSPIESELQVLIAQMSRENRLWGAKTIRDQLVLLGYRKLAIQTVRKYMIDDKGRGRGSSTWLAFLRNHLSVTWGMDFMTITTLGFKRIYVFVIIDHGTRQIVRWSVTSHPTMAWIVQQLREATAFGRQPRFMFRDNDGLYGLGVPAFLKSTGIDDVPTAKASPWQNPFVERLFGRFRGELFDHVIVFNEEHARRLLEEYFEDYYHIGRPHQGLDGQTPKKERQAQCGEQGKVVAIPVLGGLHHRYERMAA